MDETAKALGYEPRDNSEDYADEVLANSPPLDENSISDQMQGGEFCSVESGGGSAITL